MNLIIATGFTDSVKLTCAMPANLTEAACFINPSSVVGGGPVTLTVNTTPVHPSANAAHTAGFSPWAAIVLSALLLPLLGRAKRRRISSAFFLLVLAGLLAASGCSSGNSSKEDPGTAAGTYNVIVTATDASGTSPYATSVVVPITVQ